MKKKIIILTSLSIMIVLIFGGWILSKKTNKPLNLLKATEKFYKDDPDNYLFDGITNILPSISNENIGSIVVTKDGKISLRLNYHNKCYYKGFEDQKISNTLDQDKCSSYAINYRESTSMYSWNSFSLSTSKELISNLKELKVKSLYQSISSENLDKEYLEKIIDNYTKEGIEVYRLIGDSKWAFDITTPKELIEEIINYNKTVKDSAKLKGVVLDIEPHGNDEWKNGSDSTKEKIFNTYVTNMIDLYNYAKKDNLQVVLCTNTWFSRYENFENLYTNAADIYSIMNYDKRNNIDTIKEEIEIASKNHKKVETIAHSSSNSEPEESYDNFRELNNDQNKILNIYSYDQFRASYHYLPTITYLKKGTIYLSVYFSSKEKLPSKLFLTDKDGNIQEGTLINLKTDSYFLFPNVIGNEEYTLSSPNIEISNNILKVVGENGQSRINADAQMDGDNLKVGDYILYPYEYDNEEDDWGSSSSLNGWRILNITSDEIQIVSAGTPELYTYDKNYKIASAEINSQLQRYFIPEYAIQVESLTKEMIDNFCDCESEEKGEISDSLIKNGSNVLILSEKNNMFLIENTGDIYQIDNSSKKFGIRPVITINRNKITKKDNNGNWIITK